MNSHKQSNEGGESAPIPPAAGKAAHTLPVLHLGQLTSGISCGLFNAEGRLLLTVLDLGSADGEPEEAFGAAVATACNSYESDQRKIAELLAWKDAALVRGDKLHAENAALVAALEMAQERIAELSQWANIPNEGQTNDEISAALASAQGGDK